MLEFVRKYICKKVAIGLLLAFCFFELQFLLPYIEYSVNYDYIIKELCVNREDKTSTCHGKCHLSKQIKKAGEEREERKNKGIRIDRQKLLFVLFGFDTELPTIFSYRTKENIGEAPFWLKDIYLAPPTPPPQC